MQANLCVVRKQKHCKNWPAREYSLVTEHLPSTSQVLGLVPRWEGCGIVLGPAWPFAYYGWRVISGPEAGPSQRQRWAISLEGA